jgi:hypothetical protein
MLAIARSAGALDGKMTLLCACDFHYRGGVWRGAATPLINYWLCTGDETRSCATHHFHI